MKLIFVRHGQAGPYCADDAGRDLTEFGQAQAAETAAHIVQHHAVNLIIASPYNRAQQTAKILEEKLFEAGQAPDFISLDCITPDDDPAIGIDRLALLIDAHGATDDATIAIVCHMPIVARMVSILEGEPATWFELAECRVLNCDVIVADLAESVGGFIPKQPA